MDEPLKLHDSDQIHNGTYDARTGRLVLHLNDDSVHAYHSVPQEKVDGLEAAESHGKYFHQHIRNNHETSRVR